MEDLTSMVDFKRLFTSEGVGIPVPAGYRTVTDRKGFLIYGIGVLILLPFLINALTKSDPRHLTYESDDCGNFCGVKNTPIPGISCSGRDFSDKPHLGVYGCSSSCRTNYTLIEGKCVSDDEPSEAEAFITLRHSVKAALKVSRQDWWKFLFSAIITIALSVLTLVVLRYATTPLIWGIIVFEVLILAVITGIFWYAYIAGRSNSSGLLLCSALWTTILIIMIIILRALREKIRLVIQLYKEGVKVLAAMPLLMVVPVLIVFVELFILGICCLTTYYLATSFDLYEILPEKYEYHHNPSTIFTIFFNFIITIWTMLFIGAIQYMIISGTVARWYFTEKKNCLDSPIILSTEVTLEYHLGTAAFGSFLMLIFFPINSVIKLIFRNLCCRCLIILYCNKAEVLFNFFSEHSYTQTALHGQSFCTSAKKAKNLLLTNAKSVIAVNCVGEFVLVVMKIVMIVISTAVSFGLFMGPVLFHAAIPTLICFIVNTSIVCVTFGTFQTIVETLEMCFCEDLVLNDGVSQPYFMSTSFMQFIEKSKKMYGKNEPKPDVQVIREDH